MILIRTLYALIPAVLLASSAVLADTGQTDRKKILAVFPELSASAITPSPIPGLYQVMLGGQISYITNDGRYLFQGDIYDTVAEVNLTEDQRGAARQAAIDEIDVGSMIVFRPDQVKHTITVFTDIDCGYCRKLHRQMAEYNKRGIEVRYLAFPRNGRGTPSWFKAQNVWCAGDRNAALTQAKSGLSVKSNDCGATSVARHYELGRSIGIRGTPAIIVEGGELIPGYVEPDELLGYLRD